MRDWRYPTADSPRSRISDLLTPTPGFVTANPGGDRQQPMPQAEFTAMLDEGVLFSRAPGTAVEYSNFGYALLGRIVSNVSGMPYNAYVEQALLRPLGMTSTGFEVLKSPVERRAIGYRWVDGAWVEEPTMADGAFNSMGGLQTSDNRSEERRAGKEWFRTGRYRWSPDNSQKKKTQHTTIHNYKRQK